MFVLLGYPYGRPGNSAALAVAAAKKQTFSPDQNQILELLLLLLLLLGEPSGMHRNEYA